MRSKRTTHCVSGLADGHAGSHGVAVGRRGGSFQEVGDVAHLRFAVLLLLLCRCGRFDTFFREEAPREAGFSNGFVCCFSRTQQRPFTHGRHTRP